MNDTIIQPFTNIDAVPIVIGGQVADQSGSSSDTIQIGAGATCFKADSSGIWLGGNTFAAATFSVDMAGHVTAFDMTVVGGVVKYGKTSFTDTTHDGYYFGPEGLYYGSASDITRLKYTLSSGVIDFIGSHSGGSIGGQSIANIVNVATDTADIVPLSLSVNSTGVSIAGDGTLTAYVVLTWTAIVSNTFDHYIIRYKKHSYTYYTYLEATTNTITIEGLVPNTSYDFGIASANRYGTISSFSSNVTSTTAADSVAPNNVSGVSVIGSIQYNILQWTHNTDLDLASYNIYRNTTNSSATATLIGNTFANVFMNGGLTGGQPYYYWLKAVDTSGNISDNFSTVVSATPRNVASSDTNISNRGWTQTCVFSATDADTVTWGAGVFIASDGTSYSILTGNTGDMVAKTFIYLDIAVSTTAYQKTTTASAAVGDGKVLIAVAQNNTTEAIFQVFGGVGGANWNGSDIVARSVTGDEIAFNTIAGGNIIAGTLTAVQIDTTSITSLVNLSLSASQILIDGTVYLSNWRAGGDFTKIDGGKIFTNSITTTQLNFTPVQNTNVIASINASAEGITIAAANITIGGATTFASGYDPSTKIKTFVQASQPTAENTGDLWYDSDDGYKLYRWNGTAWANIQDASIGIAISAAATAQGTADGKVTTFYQSATPTAEGIGDLWVKTDSGNKLYRWSGSAWSEVQDAAIAQAIADAGTAQDTADGKIVTFYQATQPTAEGVGDVWFDTGNGNQMYRWSGSAWTAVPDANKLDLLGGSYDSAASGARVRIFPDANTGLQIIDDASNDVFKAIIGGTDVGDIIFGNWAGNQGFKYDKSAGAAGEITFKGNISGVNGTFGTISAGILDGCDIYANNLRFKRWTSILVLGSLDGWESSISAGGMLVPYAHNILNLVAPDGASEEVWIHVGGFGVQLGGTNSFPVAFSKSPGMECVAQCNLTGNGYAKLRIGPGNIDTSVNVGFKFSTTATQGGYHDGSTSYSVNLTHTINNSKWHKYRIAISPNGDNYDVNWYVDDVLEATLSNHSFNSTPGKVFGARVNNGWITGGAADYARLTIASIIYQQDY